MSNLKTHTVNKLTDPQGKILFIGCADKISFLTIKFIIEYFLIHRAPIDDHCWSGPWTTSRNDADGCCPPRGYGHGDDTARRHGAWWDAIPTASTQRRWHLLLGIIVCFLVYRKISHLHIIIIMFHLN